MFFTRKDPDSIEDYSVDWTDWLAGETLSAASWIASTGITVTAQSISGAVATARISGGQAGQRYDLTCRATSSSGRVQDQTIRIICEEM